jgi:hypothetical protein
MNLRILQARLSILAALFAPLAGSGQDQPVRADERLPEIAAIQKRKDQENYAIAMNLAKEKQWPTEIRGKEGRVAKLVGVDAYGFPMYFETYSNVNAAATIGTNNLWTGGSTGLNLTGNMAILKDKLALWDGGGVNSTHVELTGRITAKDAQGSADGHATHVAGTMIASGVSSFARGMAYGIQGILSYTFAGHLSEMATEAPNLLVSNHSYGTISGWRYNDSQSRWEFYGNPGENEDYKFGYYSSETQFWDSLAYLSPNYLIVKSSGNNRNEAGPSVGTTYWRYNSSGSMINAGPRPDGISTQNGYDLLPTYSTSKNILTVGNVLPIPNGYTKVTDVLLNSSSSVGPTDDGRIKPDIVANGTSLTSTYTGSNDAYATLSGTSMSAPTVSGSSILLQELYLRKTETTPAWSSTIRGLVIHTADEATGTPGPDYMYGWGLANFTRAARTLDNSTENVVDQRTLNNGATYTLNVVASGKSPLKVSICWTDPPAPATTGNLLNDRTKKLIHDLDIRVKRGSRVYYPWKLDVMNPVMPATRGDNDVDNVEVIEIDSTVIGETYTIEVTHKGTLTRSGTQRYTLIATGVGGKAAAASVPSSSAGSRIDSLSFGGINHGNTTVCRTYTDNRQIIGTVEVGQSAPFYLKAGSCDATNATKFAKIFFDFNSDGDFDDAGETAATSTALSNAGTFTGNISVPNTLTPGTNILMRVVLSETAAASGVTASGSYSRGETQDYQVSISNPSNDVAPGMVIYPQSGECGTQSKYVTVKIRNLGVIPKSVIPVAVEVRKGTTLVTTLRDTCRIEMEGQTETDFTLQTPFTLDAGANYTFTTTLTLTNDQLPANNTTQTMVTTSAAGASPTAVKGVICNGAEVLLRANHSAPGSQLTWFTAATGGSPFATSTSGGVVNTTNITANKTYYVSSDEIRGSVGPTSKMDFASGGYNTFSGNFVRFSNTVPMLIESVRMYTANPGSMNIILADLASETSTGYTYYNRGSRNFKVTNSRPTPSPGSLTENNTNDRGLVYNLNLVVAEPGNHILIMQCADGASVYRNNNIPAGQNPYPAKLNGTSDAFSITGNGVQAPSDPNSFYYFYYDMKVSTLTGCPSNIRVPITVANNVAPTIAQNGNVLTSSIATGNQWRLNGSDISGATTQQHTATESGLYRVVNTDDLGCVGLSNELNVVVTSVNNVDPVKIGLLLAPNPNSGLFNVRFRVNGREQLDIAVQNMLGQQVFKRTFDRFSGEFNDQIQLKDAAPGVYMLKITHGNDHYVRRILVQ